MSDRYAILGTIASGGMGTVFLGRMTGSAGFSRLVAIKRLHRHVIAEGAFVTMLVDEARMAARIRHANVIDTLDLVAKDGEFSLILEYVEGDALSALLRESDEANETLDPSIAVAIMYGVLRGLQAAHDARAEDGTPLDIIHRDVSPQNILVGVDGVPRIIDFGIAKASGRLETTKPGEIRGKFSYMAPEQLMSRPLTPQADVYSAGVVLWELLTGRRLFEGADWRDISARVLKGEIPKPSEMADGISAELDAVVARATARDVADRYFTARELAGALEPFARASDEDVGAWVRRVGAVRLAERQRLIQQAPPSGGGTLEDVMRDLAERATDDGTLRSPTQVPAVERPIVDEPETPRLPAVIDNPTPVTVPVSSRGVAPRSLRPLIVFAVGVTATLLLGVVVASMRRGESLDPSSASPSLGPLVPSTITTGSATTSTAVQVPPPMLPAEGTTAASGSSAAPSSSPAAPHPPVRSRIRKVAPPPSRTVNPGAAPE